MTMNSVRDVLVQHGQQHVASDAPLDALAWLASLPLETVLRTVQSEVARAIASPGGTAGAAIEPPVVVMGSSTGAARDEHATAVGATLLATGRVGVVIVAGGMGTRLGWDGPKGTFPIGPVSDRSMFEVFAQRLRGIQAQYGCRLPLAVQTSDANDEQTRIFFESQRFFGLNPDDIRIVRQGNLPAFDADGRIVVDASGRPIALPDGHGGVFDALARNGALEWFRERGVEHLSYLQVDNPLAPLACPEFLGHHIVTKSDFSTKVVAKTHPDEKVGVLARRSGALKVIEYSELSDELAHARRPDGRLRLGAGNTAMHAMHVDFAQRMSERGALPLHLARKPVPTAVGGETDGIKLEYFVFDALEQARRPLVFEVARSAEFAPVKGDDGEQSPHTARAALTAEVQGWMSEAGLEGDARTEAAALEVDYAQVWGPSRLRELGLSAIRTAVDNL